MVAYVYRKSDNIITDKITNVKYPIEKNSKGNIVIIGDTTSIFGNGSDYTI
jgi:hypothetical protein